MRLPTATPRTHHSEQKQNMSPATLALPNKFKTGSQWFMRQALVTLVCMACLCGVLTDALSAPTAGSRQALMSGVADGTVNQQAARQQGTGTPTSGEGVSVQGGNMQSANAMYPQPAQPSGGMRVGEAEPYQPTMKQSVPMQAPPAWAQTRYPDPLIFGLQPFGANLFRGNFANTYQEGLQPDYVLSPGDRILLRAWGAFNYDDVLVVDQQGNIFVPEVGPIHVAGTSHSQLHNAIKGSISSVFTSNVQLYTNLMSSQPVAVFVTGHVVNPGRYAGGQHDSVLYYLDRAGGIVAERGSFRKISVKRGKKVIANVDLYEFLTTGDLPNVQLQDGDVIVVRDRGMGIAATGLIRQPAFYEFDGAHVRGASLADVAWPQPSASHVSVSGTRKGTDFHTYMTMAEFRSFKLQDEDIVEFHADTPGETIMVGATGAIVGNSRFPVMKGTTLLELLNYIKVDGNIASTDAIYIRRQSVAEQQKKNIKDSLIKLEQRALTATSSSSEEAEIRIKEAELIQDFVKRASSVEPDGIVVVAHKGVINDLVLEEGDTIYVPQRSDVVQITGEVTIPKTVVYNDSLKLKDYVNSAGGYTDRAEKGKELVLKPNGEIGPLASLGVGPGDQIMVLPAYDTKAVQAVKDIVQIIYQVAVSAGVVLVPFWS